MYIRLKFNFKSYFISKLSLFFKVSNLVLALSFSLISQNTLAGEAKPISCNKAMTKKSDHPHFVRSKGKPEDYISEELFNPEEAKEVIAIIRKSSPVKFFKMIPPKFLPKGVKRSILKGDNLFQTADINLFHGTSYENAISIFNSQRFKLTDGVFNTGSASFAWNENHYPMYMKITTNDKIHKNTVFKVRLNSTAKVLDLRRDAMHTEASELSLFRAYREWYYKNLDKIVSEYKELEELRDRMIKESPEYGSDRFNDVLLTVENFGHFLGADLLMVTRKYGQRNNDEFSLINPDSIKSVLPHIGRDPREPNKVKIVDYSYGREIEYYK